MLTPVIKINREASEPQEAKRLTTAKKEAGEKAQQECSQPSSSSDCWAYGGGTGNDCWAYGGGK